MQNSNDINRIENVTRLEVIGEDGRLVVLYNVVVRIEYQDDSKTLKLFTAKRAEQNK